MFRGAVFFRTRCIAAAVIPTFDSMQRSGKLFQTVDIRHAAGEKQRAAIFIEETFRDSKPCVDDYSRLAANYFAHNVCDCRIKVVGSTALHRGMETSQ